MGWSIGFDSRWKRDIGYGVPARCDFPCCDKKIGRGLSHVCGSEPYGGEHGCGLYFCSEHLIFHPRLKVFLCKRCHEGRFPFNPRQDVREWVEFKLTDDSWEAWRQWNPEAVKSMMAALKLITLERAKRTV